MTITDVPTAPTTEAVLAAVVRTTFEAGLSPAIVERRWPAFTVAFSEFDPHAVAGLADARVDAMAGDAALVRNHAKMRSTVANAATVLELEAEHGPLGPWLQSLPYDEARAALAQHFTRIGPSLAERVLELLGLTP